MGLEEPTTWIAPAACSLLLAWSSGCSGSQVVREAAPHSAVVPIADTSESAAVPREPIAAEASPPIAVQDVERVSVPSALHDPPPELRFRGADLHAAALFAGEQLRTDVIVVADTAAISVDVPSSPTMAAFHGLADRVGLGVYSARPSGAVWLAPSDVIGRARTASARGLRGGRAIDTQFERVEVGPLVRLLGEVERLEITSGLTGTVSVQLRAFPARQVLSDLARLAGATVERRARRLTIGAGNLGSAPSLRDPPDCPSWSYREVVAGCIDLDELHVVGMIGGRRPAALLAAPGLRSVSFSRGEYVGPPVVVPIEGDELPLALNWRVERVASEGVLLRLVVPGEEVRDERFLPFSPGAASSE